MVETKPVRVLLTRPEPGASRTAALLLQQGFLPISLPLTEIRRVDAVVSDAGYDAVAVTSANAMRCASPALIAPFRHLPCLAVGGQTAIACRAAGFTDVIEGSGNAAELAGCVIERTVAGASVLYLCGFPRKPTLEAILRTAGREVDAVEVYRAVRLIPEEKQRQLLAQGGFDAALVYSPESAAALRELLAALPVSARLNALFLCLSADVAQALPAFARTITATVPTEADLLRVLRASFPSAR